MDEDGDSKPEGNEADGCDSDCDCDCDRGDGAGMLGGLAVGGSGARPGTDDGEVEVRVDMFADASADSVRSESTSSEAQVW